MRESPRMRRLRADLRGMEQLRDESSIVDFSVPSVLYGGPPEIYTVRFHGNGFWRPEGSQDTLIRQQHVVSIHLGASYPRMMPELAWKTPIFHPNISAGGVVCLGGYSTHWAPSLNLHELCGMLWDMIRYQNYDVESPYNREAALWARSQKRFQFPVDPRPVRDRLAIRSTTRSNRNLDGQRRSSHAQAASDDVPVIDDVPVLDDVTVIDEGPVVDEGIEIIDAEIIEVDAGRGEDQDILFLN